MVLTVVKNLDDHWMQRCALREKWWIFIFVLVIVGTRRVEFVCPQQRFNKTAPEQCPTPNNVSNCSSSAVAARSNRPALFRDHALLRRADRAPEHTMCVSPLDARRARSDVNECLRRVDAAKLATGRLIVRAPVNDTRRTHFFPVPNRTLENFSADRGPRCERPACNKQPHHSLRSH